MQNSLNASPNRRLAYAGLASLVLLLVAFDCSAAELEQKTIAAFEHYVRAAQEQMKSDLRPDGAFLWADKQSGSKRRHEYKRLRSGQFIIQQVQRSDDGHDIDIPDGMVHDWLGIMFVPGATLETAQAILQNYSQYARIYAPQVRRSKLLHQAGDDERVFLQLYKSAPRTVAFDADFRVERTQIDTTHATSSSISFRIAELKDPDNPDSAEFPIGQGNGYLWRMNNYWRYEQKDGGVYMQVESISLSRDVPGILSLFVKPIIHHIARETLTALLDSTRHAIQKGAAQEAGEPDPASASPPAH